MKQTKPLLKNTKEKRKDSTKSENINGEKKGKRGRQQFTAGAHLRMNEMNKTEAKWNKGDRIVR